MTGWDAGLVNAHTHLYSGLSSLGMPAPKVKPMNFVEILQQVWWKLDRALDEDMLRAAARLTVADAVLAGTTGLIDHHESPNSIEGSLDVLADVCQEIGIRAVLCYGVTERNGGRDEARRGLEECARFIASNHRPLVRGVLGIHASFTVSDETLFDIGDVARDLETVVHVHVAEDRADVADARVRGYEGPLQRLLENETLPPGSILAHGVHLSADEMALANENGLWLVQNPRSNKNNGVGYPMSIHAADRVALGTDGFPSDMLEEAAVLLTEAREHEPDPEESLTRMERGGELLAERFNGGGSTPDACVRVGTVLVDGCEVVRDGQLVTADFDAIRVEAEVQAGRLWARMAAL